MRVRKSLVLALCSCALAVATFGGASAAESSHTVVRFVSPFTKTGVLKRADAITSTVNGVCPQPSPIGGSDTSECSMTGGTFGYAVCWPASKALAKYAMCTSDIRSNRYVKVLTQRAPEVFANVTTI